MPQETELTDIAKVSEGGTEEDEHKRAQKNWAKVRNVVKANAKFHHRHKHKIIGGTFLVVVAVVVIIVLTVAIAAVAFIYSRSPKEKARDAATASAAVKIGTISVVPPKEEAADGSRRRILGTASLFKTLSQITDKRKFRGLADSDEIDVSTFAVDSDYNTATKSEYAEDGLGEALEIPNAILCMLAQTNADLFMTLEGNDQEPYIANVDESKCFAQGGGGSGPRMTPWTIVATVPSEEACDTNEQGEKVNCGQVPSDSGKIQVHAWLLINSGAQELEFKLEVEKSTLIIREDGSFKINDLQIQFKEKGYDEEQEPKQKIAGVIKYNTKGDTSSFGYYFSMGSAITAESTVTTDADGNSAESGWAKASVVSYDYQTGQPSTDVMQLSWNDDSLNLNGNICLNREDYVPVGESYTLFDSKGKRVHVQGHYRISKVLDAAVTVNAPCGEWVQNETSGEYYQKTEKGSLPKGKKVEGGIHAYGLYFDAWDHEAQSMEFSWCVADAFAEEIFGDGAAVMIDLNDGKEPKEGNLKVSQVQSQHGYPQTTASVKITGGKLITPQKPIQVELKFPSTFNVRTLSNANYAKKAVTFTYENGWIDGLPMACYDRNTFLTIQANNTWPPCRDGLQSMPDVLLPDGVPVTSKDGKKTKYILKAKTIRQVFRPQASSKCSSLGGAPDTAVLPTADDIGKLDLTKKPSGDGLKIKVEGGEVKAEFLPDGESFTPS